MKAWVSQGLHKRTLDYRVDLIEDRAQHRRFRYLLYGEPGVKPHILAKFMPKPATQGDDSGQLIERVSAGECYVEIIFTHMLHKCVDRCFRAAIEVP